MSVDFETLILNYRANRRRLSPAGEEESKDTQVAMSIKKEEVPSNPEEPQGFPKRFKTKAEWMYHQPWYKPLARHKKEFPLFSQLTWEEIEEMEKEFEDWTSGRYPSI